MSLQVFDPPALHPRIQHQPQEVYSARGWEYGFDITPPTVGRVAFADVIGLSVFETAPVQGKAGKINLLLFVRGRPRPLHIDDPGKIQYQDFTVLDPTRSGMEKFKDLAVLTVRSARSSVVDRATLGFLHGGQIQRLERELLMHATAFASVLGHALSPQPVAPQPVQPQMAMQVQPQMAPPAVQPQTPAQPQMPVQPQTTAQPQTALPSPPPMTPSAAQQRKPSATPRRPASTGAVVLPFTKALAYPVNGKPLMVLIKTAGLLLFFNLLIMVGAWPVAAVFNGLALFYVPSLLFAIIRTVARHQPLTPLPNPFEVLERIFDTVAWIGTAVVSSLIILPVFVVVALTATYLASLMPHPVVTIIVMLLLFVPTSVWAAGSLSMGFGAVAVYGRSKSFQLLAHQTAFFSCRQAAIETVLMPQVVMLPSFLILFAFGAQAVPMSSITAGALLGMIVTSVASVYMAFVWSYLVGTSFRLMQPKLNEIYRQA